MLRFQKSLFISGMRFAAKDTAKQLTASAAVSSARVCTGASDVMTKPSFSNRAIIIGCIR